MRSEKDDRQIELHPKMGELLKSAKVRVRVCVCVCVCACVRVQVPARACVYVGFACTHY